MHGDLRTRYGEGMEEGHALPSLMSVKPCRASCL